MSESGNQQISLHVQIAKLGVRLWVRFGNETYLSMNLVSIAIRVMTQYFLLRICYFSKEISVGIEMDEDWIVKKPAIENLLRQAKRRSTAVRVPIKDLQEAYDEVMLELRVRKNCSPCWEMGLEEGVNVLVSKICHYLDIPYYTVYYWPVRAAFSEGEVRVGSTHQGVDRAGRLATVR